jgi:hypothetical protein
MNKAKFIINNNEDNVQRIQIQLLEMKCLYGVKTLVNRNTQSWI